MFPNPIFDITPFTVTDYPDHLSCVVWFAGCNMRCSYCYNANIVLGNGTKKIKDILAFLENRVGKLEAVVLSGGECMLYRGLFEFCEDIKKLGFKIKIDTNGSNPQVLEKLISAKFVDFISLDFKAPKRLFRNITASNFYETTIESLKLLLKNSTPFEVRTTIHADLLNERDINDIIDVLYENSYKNSYFLQSYLHTQTSLGRLKEPSKLFNINLLSNKLDIKLRNF